MTGTVLWLGAEPLLLASGSATRRMLLEAAGLPVAVQPADVDERGIEAPLAAAQTSSHGIALALARAKSLSVSGMEPDRIVLGADQTLSVDGRSLHKPASLEVARDQIASLSGRRHELNSAFALARNGDILAAGVDTATLTMRPLSPGFLDLYLAAAGPGVCDSVGGYKLEGVGVHLFERIEGDHSTILGLPLLPLLRALRDLGLLAG